MKIMMAFLLAWSFSASPVAGSKIMTDEPQDCDKTGSCADKIDSIEMPATRGEGSWSEGRKQAAKPMERKVPLPPPPQDDPDGEQPK
jgi:hypothetical protein